MKQFAVIGAGVFGKRVLDELILLDCEIILIDKDPELIEYFKSDVAAAYIADVINEEIVVKLIPADIDAVVIDLGDKIETSILVTQYLGKLGVSKIIVKAETDQHGEILSIIGADHVVFPNFEAAKRVAPLLVSDLLFNYFTISGGLVMAETGVPADLAGHTVLESEIRKSRGISIVAFRSRDAEDFRFFDPGRRIAEDDVLLIVGREEDVMRFSGRSAAEASRGAGDMLRRFFGGKPG